MEEAGKRRKKGHSAVNSFLLYIPLSQQAFKNKVVIRNNKRERG